MIRRLLWWIRRTRPVDALEAGTCGWCRRSLEECPRCGGAWRSQPCDCGIGLICAEHGRHWS